MFIRIISIVTVLLSAVPLMAQTINGSVTLENQKFEDLTVNGKAVFENSNFNALTVRGNLEFQDISIANTLEVKGNVSGKNLNCDNLVVRGSLKGEGLSVAGKADIAGGLSVSNSNFDDLSLASEEAELENSSVEVILVKKTGSGKEILILTKTVVGGDVTFESGNGKLILKDALVKGKVNGGEIVRE